MFSKRHFTIKFLVGEGLEDLKRSHLALQADALIPEEIMQEVYGKGRDRQVSDGEAEGMKASKHGGGSLLFLERGGVD